MYDSLKEPFKSYFLHESDYTCHFVLLFVFILCSNHSNGWMFCVVKSFNYCIQSS